MMLALHRTNSELDHRMSRKKLIVSPKRLKRYLPPGTL
jgi:hypothetical protein